MTQGKNVLRGDRLVVDLTTGVSRVESTRPGKAASRACSCQAAPDAISSLAATGKTTSPLMSPLH